MYNGIFGKKEHPAFNKYFIGVMSPVKLYEMCQMIKPAVGASYRNLHNLVDKWFTYMLH